MCRQVPKKILVDDGFNVFRATNRPLLYLHIFTVKPQVVGSHPGLNLFETNIER